MSTRQLNMDDLTYELLCGYLSKNEQRCMALARLRHCSEAERTLLLQEAAVCQMAYLQLEGITPGPDGGIDWSAEVPVPGQFSTDPAEEI